MPWPVDFGVEPRRAGPWLIDSGVARRWASCWLIDSGVDRRRARPWLVDFGVEYRSAKHTSHGALVSGRETSEESHAQRKFTQDIDIYTVPKELADVLAFLTAILTE